MKKNIQNNKEKILARIFLMVYHNLIKVKVIKDTMIMLQSQMNRPKGSSRESSYKSVYIWKPGNQGINISYQRRI